MSLVILLTSSCVSNTVHQAKINNYGAERKATGEVTDFVKENVTSTMQEAWFLYMLTSQMQRDPSKSADEKQILANVSLYLLGEWTLGLNYLNTIVPPPSIAPPTLSIVCPV